MRPPGKCRQAQHKEFCLPLIGKELHKALNYSHYTAGGTGASALIPLVKPFQGVLLLYSTLCSTGYWNAGGQQNVESMLTFLTEEYLKQSGAPPPAVLETPATGAPHPACCLRCWPIQPRSGCRTLLSDTLEVYNFRDLRV